MQQLRNLKCEGRYFPNFTRYVLIFYIEISFNLTSLQAENRGQKDGLETAFEIVPFPDGADPTQHPVMISYLYAVPELTYDQHNLPPLLSVDVIDSLPDPDIIMYLQGYQVDPPVGPD